MLSPCYCWKRQTLWQQTDRFASINATTWSHFPAFPCQGRQVVPGSSFQRQCQQGHRLLTLKQHLPQTFASPRSTSELPQNAAKCTGYKHLEKKPSALSSKFWLTTFLTADNTNGGSTNNTELPRKGEITSVPSPGSAGSGRAGTAKTNPGFTDKPPFVRQQEQIPTRLSDVWIQRSFYDWPFFFMHGPRNPKIFKAKRREQ